MRRRTVLLIVLAHVGLLLGLAVLAVLSDEGPPEDGDLTRRSEVLAAENGFSEIDLSEDHFHMPPGLDHFPDPGEERFRDLALELLEANRDLLNRMERALRYPRFQVPSPFLYLGIINRLKDLLVLRARVHLDGRQVKDALGDAAALVRFGLRLEGAEGGIIMNMLGHVALAEGARILSRCLLDQSTREADLLDVAAELEGTPSEREFRHAAFRSHYHLCANEIDQLSAGKEALEISWSGKWYRRLLLKPNRTKNALAEATRAAISGSGQQIQTRLWPINPAGEKYARTFEEALDFFTKRSRRRELEVPFARVLVALKRYKLAQGDLPGSLEDLVPRFLKEVPKDPYDGKPLRYSEEKRIVWSVGEDGVDSGGQLQEGQENSPFDPREPTFRIEF